MAVKASEIESYKGDSALAGAGGLGAQGTQIAVSSVWKMADAINQSSLALREQEFKKNREEYAQKIKDRDAVGAMISSGQFNTNEMDEETRLRIRDGVSDMRNEFIQESKKGVISDEGYLRIKEKYSNLTREANIAKTNYLAMKADEKENAEPYDKEGPKSTTQVNTYDAEGKVSSTTQTTTPSENIRRSAENMSAYQKHIKLQQEKIKADPYHIYEPFVPVSKIDQKLLYPEIGYDVTEKDLGRKKEITKTPSFDKTADYYVRMQSDPEFRKQQDREYENIVNLPAGESVVDNTNAKIKLINEENAKNGKPLLPFINGQTSKPMFLALHNYAKQYDTPKTSIVYKSKNDEKLDYDEQKSTIETNDNIRQAKEVSKVQTDDNIRQAQEVAKIAPKVNSDGTVKGVSSTALTQIYKSRADEIATHFEAGYDKEAKLKELQKEIFGMQAFANSENRGEVNNNPHYFATKGKDGKIIPRKSSALGTFGIMEDSGHGKEAFEKSPLFRDARNRFKTYNEYYKYLAKNSEEYTKEFSPKYMQYLKSKAGDNIEAQLAFNYGGKEGLDAYRAGNLDYKPKNNSNTLAQHIANALDPLTEEPKAEPKVKAKAEPKAKKGVPQKVSKTTKSGRKIEFTVTQTN